MLAFILVKNFFDDEKYAGFDMHDFAKLVANDYSCRIECKINYLVEMIKGKLKIYIDPMLGAYYDQESDKFVGTDLKCDQIDVSDKIAKIACVIRYIDEDDKLGSVSISVEKHVEYYLNYLGVGDVKKAKHLIIRMGL